MSTDLLDQAEVCEYLTDMEQTVGVGANEAEGIDTVSEREGSGWVRRIQLTTYDVVIEGNGEEPEWLLPTSESLKALLLLPSKWDSYGARSVAPESAVEALRLLFSFMADDSPRPQVVPTCRGGVQLEWHTRGIDMEIEVMPSGRILASYEDQHTEWEREIRGDIRPLEKAMAELSG